MQQPQATPSRRPDSHAPWRRRASRLRRHLWAAARQALPGYSPRLSRQALARLAAQVRESETRHSGEIRLCIESHLAPAAAWAGLAPRARALAVFAELGVWDTAANNGVLIYLLQADRAIEIVADRGLSDRVAPETWQAIVRALAQQLASGQDEAGLSQALAAVDALLVTHFARAPGSADCNELPDAPVMR